MCVCLTGTLPDVTILFYRIKQLELCRDPHDCDLHYPIKDRKTRISKNQCGEVGNKKSQVTLFIDGYKKSHSLRTRTMIVGSAYIHGH